jgi:hypothetical protein
MRNRKTLAWANGTSRRAVGGRVRKMRAVGDQSAPIPERERASLGGSERSRQTILLARRTRTMKLCSSDARTEGQSGDSFGRCGVEQALVQANDTSPEIDCEAIGGWGG